MKTGTVSIVIGGAGCLVYIILCILGLRTLIKKENQEDDGNREDL